MRFFFAILLLHIGIDCFAIQGGEAVKIGGIQQWIQYEGPDEEAPVLLFLHGGPGNSVISYAEKFTKNLKRHFIVVLWDQRQSGKTADINSSDRPLTVPLFVEDAVEVIEYLRKKFNRTKIYLVGHSWGGYLGLRVAAERPDLLNACFAMSPMINQLKSERLALTAMMDKATKENNSEALKELGQVNIPFESGLQLYYDRKWLSHLQGSTTPKLDKVEEWAKTWLALFNEGCGTNFMTFAPKLDCPVYFLIGSRDYQTHFSLAQEYFNQLVCPRKSLIWFTNSAHSPNLTETEKFESTLIGAIVK